MKHTSNTEQFTHVVVAKYTLQYNINIIIYSIDIKFDGKQLKSELITRLGDTNNSVKYRWVIVPKMVEQLNDYLFIDTYKSIKIKIGMNKIRVNDSEMSIRWNNEAWPIPDISVLRSRWIQTKEEKNGEEMSFYFLRNREVERSETA